jgi:phosphatidylinositol alpha-1,6-mannosyltransferase
MSRAEQYKGHRELIAAWPEVLQRIPGAQLWIAGDGDLRPDLEQLTHQQSLRASVRFWGQVSEEEKERLILASRCLLLPSRGEGFGLVYAEAMRLGRPCLVAPIGAGSELVQPPSAGLAADPAKTDDLVDAVCRLMTPGPSWDSWSRNAQERYESAFTSFHFQQRFRGLIAELQSENAVCVASRV